MARVPEIELQRLKELKRCGKDWLGRCPFRGPDTEPSLNVSASKNLWNCFGCGIGGGPIDWVIKSRGVSLKEGLKADPSFVAGTAPARRTTVRSLPAPVGLDADDQALLGQTIDHHQRPKETSGAQAYLGHAPARSPGAGGHVPAWGPRGPGDMVQRPS